MNSSLPIIETRWVRARMEPKYEVEKTNKKIGTRSVWKRKGLLGKKVQVEEDVYEEILHETGEFSDVTPDFRQLSEMVAEACEDLEALGYQVISIMPVNEGLYRWQSLMNSSVSTKTYGGGYGYGYGVTRGAVITGRREART